METVSATRLTADAPADTKIEDIPAILLVGGAGTRLRSVVSSAPKPLAAVGDKPFLELLVRQLRHQGVRRVVMCTGHLADQVEGSFGDGSGWDLKIDYSRETSPLGTAGALRFALARLDRDSEFLVMNGDSFLEVDFEQMLKFHRERGGMVTMAVIGMQNASRYGTVQTDGNRRLTAFVEKGSGEGPGLINGGVYVIDRALREYLPERPASLEKDVLPKVLNHGVYALEQHGMFIDIGTPEDYERAQQLRDRLYQAALSPLKPECAPPEGSN